jgi:hypothetical protein
VTIRYRPLRAVATISQVMPVLSVARATYVMSRVWRSVKLAPSLTTYCNVSTFVLSTVG